MKSEEKLQRLKEDLKAKRESMKKFMQLRRQQINNVRSDQNNGAKTKLNEYIMQNDFTSFEKCLFEEKPEFVFSYLISQDQLLKTPLIYIFEQASWFELSQAINKWSNANYKIVQKEIQRKSGADAVERNVIDGDVKGYFKNKFSDIIRCICNRQELSEEKLVQILSQENTLFSQLMRMFLNYENIINFIPEQEHIRLFLSVFLKIAEKLNLPCVEELKEYGGYKMRDKIWKQKSFATSLFDENILELKEIKYNFMHELALKKDQAIIYNILDHIEQNETNKESLLKIQEIKQRYFSNFDGSNETALDIILKKWSYPSISKFLQRVKELDWIHLSTNCINKVLINNQLKQHEVQEIISKFLDGQISERGYSQRVLKEKLVKTKVFQKIISVEDSGYVIVMDRRRVLMAKDRRHSYPLLNYLDRFKQNCSLKITSLLFFPFIDRKVIKTKVISLLKTIGIECKQFYSHNQALKQIQEVIYYHQSLLNFICRLKNQNILTYLTDKLFINYSNISIWSKTNGSPILHMINRHFLITYIENSQDLSDNALNRKIIDKIFNSKENEKFVHNFNLYVELVRQFHQNPKLCERKEWLVSQVKDKVRTYIKTLKSDDFIEIFSCFNEGQTQRKVLLIDLLPPLFSQQQIQAMNLPQKPQILNEQQMEKQKKKRKKIENSPQQKMKKYEFNQTYENFQKQLKIRAKQIAKQKKSQNLEQKIQQKRYERSSYPEWFLKLEEPELEKKIKKLCENGYQIIFKTHKQLIKHEQEHLKQLSEPYRTIVRSMLKNTSNRRSLSFHLACLICRDEDNLKIKELLINSSQKFKEIACEWENKALYTLAVNPYLLLEIISTETLAKMYKVQQPYERHLILNNIMFGMNYILRTVGKSKKLKPQQIEGYVYRMLCYKKILSKLGLEEHEQKFKEIFISFMQLHSDEIDISLFFENISIEEIFYHYGVFVYMNAVKASKSPIALLQKMHKLMSQKGEVFQNLSQSLSQNQQNQDLGGKDSDENEEEFDPVKRMAKHRFGFSQKHLVQFAKFWDVLNKLSLEDFGKYLQLFKPSTYIECKQLIHRLEDEKKCLLVLDVLIEINSNDQQFGKSLIFVPVVKQLVKTKLQKFNAALSAFVPGEETIYFHNENRSPNNNKVVISHLNFIETCNSDVYETYLKYIGDMMKLCNFESNPSIQGKTKILYAMFTELFNAQNWLKLIKLLQQIRRESKTKQFKEINIHIEFNLIEKLLDSFFDLASKNIERSHSYNNKQLYYEMIQSLFTILQESKVVNNQQLFYKAWVLDPDRAVEFIKIYALSFITISNCLKKYPEKVKLIKDIPINTTSFPNKYRHNKEGKYFPLSTYYFQDFQAHLYLVDLLIYEQKVKKLWFQIHGNEINKYLAAFAQKKKSVILAKQVMKRYSQIYSPQQISLYCCQLLSLNNLNSLKEVPPAYLDAYFAKNKEIRGISNMKQNIINQLIEMKKLNRDYILDIIKSSRISIIENFMKKNDIKIDYNLIKEIQKNYYYLNKNRSFISTLIELENQKFVEQFLNKYHIFNLYEGEAYTQMTKDLIWDVTLLHRVSILRLFLEHLKVKQANKLTFAEAPLINQHQQILPPKGVLDQNKIHEQNISIIDKKKFDLGVRNGVVYLPLTIAGANNFYEYYFLLLQNGINKKQKFKSSYRFFNECNPQEFAFIPEMKKRLGLVKIILNYFRQRKDKMDFFLNIIFPSIFQLNMQYKDFNKKEKEIDGDNQQLFELFAKLNYQYVNVENNRNEHLMILLLKTMPNVKISDEVLNTNYQQHVKLINYLLTNLKLQVKGHENIERILSKKEDLRELLYIAEPKYLKSCRTSQLHLFSYAFTMQVRYFERPENIGFMELFISQCYFNSQSNSPFSPRFGDKLMKDLLLCCLVSKYEGRSVAMNKICELAGKTPEQMLLELSLFMGSSRECKKIEPNYELQRAQQPKQTQYIYMVALEAAEINHNPAFWNSALEHLKKMNNLQKFTKSNTFKPFFIQKYKKMINFEKVKASLTQAGQGLSDVFSCLSFLCNLVYLISESKYLSSCATQYGLSNTQIQLHSDKQLKIEAHDNILVIHTPIQIIKEDMIKFCKLNEQSIKQQIQRHIYFQNLKKQNQFIDEIQCMSKLTFKFDIESFRKCQSISLLKKMINSNTFGTNGINTIHQEFEKLKELIVRKKNMNSFSLSDIHGPITINDQTDKNKVVECISFYEFCELPPSQIAIKYMNGIEQIGLNKLKILSDLKQYMRYFKYQINDDQSQNKIPYNFSNTIYMIPKKNKFETYEIIFDQLFVYNIIKFFLKIQMAGEQMSAKFNHEIIFKYSVTSIINLMDRQKQKIKTSLETYQFVNQLINNNRNILMIEAILIMILEDANNIMKAVKGIIVIYEYKEKCELKENCQAYQINESLAFYSIKYQIQDQIFRIIILTGPPKSKDTNKNMNVDVTKSGLVSRKEFLNSIFTSTEFLTGYFLNKTQLNTQLVKMSKEISELVNEVVNFSINYNELYSIVDYIKEQVNIKQIDEMLTNLNGYILFNLKKFITNYLASKELACYHQVSLINCFNKMIENSQSTKKLNQWCIGSKKTKDNGLTYISNFSTELQSKEKKINIKNMCLIQIYKNYFASVVREGMSFILGYKSNKPPLLIQLQKKEDIDKVNITQISFLVLISNRIPTNDQINHDKIIRIYVVDLHENVYQLNKSVTEKLLQLSQQSPDRIISHLVPVLQPNVILTFDSEYLNKKQNFLDDASNKYVQLHISRNNKFKIENKNRLLLSCIDQLRIDIGFNKAFKKFTDIFNNYFEKNIDVVLKSLDLTDMLLAVEIFNFFFLDFEQVLVKIFDSTPRQKQLQLFVSAEEGKDIIKNPLLVLKLKLFESLFDTIHFQICEQKSNIVIDGKTIKIFINMGNYHDLNVQVISDKLLQHMITKLGEKDAKISKIYNFINKVQHAQQILDYLLMANVQLNAIEKGLELSYKSKLEKKVISNYKIKLVTDEKTFIKFVENVLTFYIRLDARDRKFFSVQQILQFIFNGEYLFTTSITSTQYNLNKKCIEFYNYNIEEPTTIILAGKEKIEVIEAKFTSQGGNNKKSTMLFENQKFSSYYVIQKQNQAIHVDHNYFWKTDPKVEYLSEKTNKRIINTKYSLILVSPLPINISEQAINVKVHVAKNQNANDTANILKKCPQFNAQIHLLSKQIMLLQFTPFVSSTITFYLGKFKVFNAQKLQQITITCSSNKQMVEDNTKFVELIFRNKVIKPNIIQYQKKELNLIFNEPAQKIKIEKQMKEVKEAKSAQSMVYIINENARKFITRAGQARIDVINVCDEEGNPTTLRPGTEIQFRHLNLHSEIIIPQIKEDGMRIELIWTPTIRGPYEVFLNNTRLNPNYEIGVCAALFDIKASKITLPKKTQTCFSEQTEFTIQLKDHFGNIYTQLEQSILNDALMIEIQSEDANKNMIKVKAEKINKYGQKKVRFSIDDPTSVEERDIIVSALINLEKIFDIGLRIKGQSLAQRVKNLEKDIDASTKRYQTDAVISRKNFLGDLFKLAQKNLDKNFSIKFAGEQGIDAGGLKRQFYDMIGKEMKDPSNPFFIQIDSTRHNEYFFNPEIIKNKKKNEYMELFGKFLANSFINAYLIGINFSPTFIKMFYQDPITFEDMLRVLPKEQANRYQYLLQADAQSIEDLQLYFSVILNRKKGQEVEMIENGKNVKVTTANLAQYLNLLPKFLIEQRYNEIMNSFRSGFNSVLCVQTVRRWIRSDEFWCKTAGVKQLTPELVLSYVNINGGQEKHHAWFRAYIMEANKQILQGFLKFSSGSSSIDFYQTSKIVVKFEYQDDNPKKLPISHTCWKEIDIPAYKSYAIMKQLLNAAFLYCSEGFGFG